ncbi:MAG TPA: hypothetical protein VNN08_23410, partial [Thermoanaerobaculia bacterium]|nr:hypothetical protein [Thermoanaerobaculia bacterium]
LEAAVHNVCDTWNIGPQMIPKLIRIQKGLSADDADETQMKKLLSAFHLRHLRIKAFKQSADQKSF